ncbi:hypothetical protein AB0I27_25465 [Streptomyces sp. NPDC050597]|jgi:hypothetical protein|uniref:hypothetical protein n=1 Tax=Streptomyces sp. NPDC050597 TaxID=3157212 RepID=UPI00118098AA|nr:hypothetical protein [Streptomyces sp. IB201691-2A2]TRO62897.1 hypothetical protein E4K73_18830 [Streptomyces sp. IB201691-2A2]
MTGRMGRIGGWGLALCVGGLWWWAVMRLAFAPDAGVLEGAVAAGGWGLSLLPVHCVPKGRAAGAAGSDQWARRVSEAWRRRRGPLLGREGSS